MPDVPTSAKSGEVLRFDDVSLHFDDTPALDHVSFEMEKGETRIVLGAAGSGKTTMLKTAVGLAKPDSGEVYLFRTDVTHFKESELYDIRSKVGILFQEGGLFDSLTVSENVAYPLLNQRVVSEKDKLSEDAILERVRESLRFVELEHTLEKFPSELSGGMRRRVAIARAIITQPELLLYDSPTGGLDPVTSNTIVELIMKQRDVYKTSSLLVTHRLQDAFVMAANYFDRKANEMRPLPPGARGEVPMAFLILRDGKVIFDGDAHELAESKDEYIREYIS